jgi:predicted permease
MYLGNKADGRVIARKIALFPPFIALLVALIVAATPGWPPLIEAVLARIGSTLAPLALFSVGLQLRFQVSRHRALALLAGLGWKLGIAPLIVFAIGGLLHFRAPMLSITVLQTAMAPMITGAILAEQNNLDPPLANMMVGIGILLSFITVPLWNLLV